MHMHARMISLSAGPDRICASSGCSCSAKNLATSCGENETVLNKKKKKTTAQKVPPLSLSPETSERKSRVNDHRDIQLTDRQAIRLNFYARWNIQKVLNFV